MNQESLMIQLKSRPARHGEGFPMGSRVLTLWRGRHCLALAAESGNAGDCLPQLFAQAKLNSEQQTAIRETGSCKEAS